VSHSRRRASACHSHSQNSIVTISVSKCSGYNAVETTFGNTESYDVDVMEEGEICHGQYDEGVIQRIRANMPVEVM
jgi:hypothetical protein